MRLRVLAIAAIGSLAALFVGPSVNAQFEGAKLCTSEGMVRWTPTEKWPPNHKFFDVDIKFNEEEQDGDTTKLEVTGITHDEVGIQKGSTKRHDPDWHGVGASGVGVDGVPPQPPIAASVTVRLRSERMGSKDGRDYFIDVSCTDTGDVSGGPSETGTATLKVSIPHDQGNK